MKGKELKRLERALIAAFPTESELARLVRYGLDEHLETITQAPSQQAKVFDLLRWAEAQGRLDTLKAAALEENPDNPALQELAQATPPATVQELLLTGLLQTAELALSRRPVANSTTATPPESYRRQWRLNATLYMLPQTDKRFVILSQQCEIRLSIPGLVSALRLDKDMQVWAPVVNENWPVMYRFMDQIPPREFESPLVRSSESEVILDGPGRVRLSASAYTDPSALPETIESATVTISLPLHLVRQPLVIEGTLPLWPPERRRDPPVEEGWEHK